MEVPVVVKTDNNNFYIYSVRFNHFFLVPQILYDIITSERNNINLDNLIKETSNSIRINNNEYSYCDAKFYYSKYLYLIQHKIFQKKRLKWIKEFSKESIMYEIYTRPNIVFETTTSCNLKCEYCGFGDYYDNYGQRVKDVNDYDTAKKIIDFNLDLCHQYSGAEIITFYIGFYGGEPLLNFSFINKIVNYVKQLETDTLKFKFNMSTNCLLLSKYSKFLFENDFSLFLSLDGDAESNSYRKYHNNKPSFQKVFDNIKALQSTYPEYFKRKVKVNSVLHNKNSIGGLIEFFNKEFSINPTLSQLSTIGIASNKVKVFKEKFYSNPTKNVNRFKCFEEQVQKSSNLKLLASFFQNTNVYKFRTYSELLADKETINLRPTSTCNPFNRKIFVSTKGELFACEKIGRNFMLGRFDNKNDIVDIYYERINSIYNEIFNKVIKLCKNCYRYENCATCVFELINHDGSISGCHNFIDVNEYPSYLKKYIEIMEESADNYNDSIEKHHFT